MEELMYTIIQLDSKFNIKAKIKWRKKDEGIFSGLKFDIRDTDKLLEIILNSDLGKLARNTMPYKFLA